MSKVSKNLKKIRNEKNLTQEALAEKVHVTRQAISNWETEKTKPDIDSLLSLAEALEVQVEELIYGEKKEKLEIQDKSKKKNAIKIILGISGSVFFAVGLGLIFFEFWSKFPVAIQGVFAFLPALLGQLSAVFVMLKKRDNISWREGAAIIWTVGVVLTVALFNEIFSLSFGYFNCMAIDIVLTAPVMFILKSVSPLAFYYYMTLHTCAEGRWEYLIFGLVFFLVGVAFNCFAAKNKDDVRGKYTQWITVIASIPLVFILTSALENLNIIDNCFNGAAVLLLAYFICMFTLSVKANTFTLPYKPVSIIGICAVMAFMSVNREPIFQNGIIKQIFVSLVFAAVPIICLLIRRNSTDFSLLEILLISVPSVFIGVYGVLAGVENVLSPLPNYNDGVSFAIVSALIFVFGAVLVINGITELKLMYVNVGLIQIFAQIILIASYFDADIIAYGIMFLVFGISIFTANGKLLSVKKLSGEREKNEE